MPRKPGKRGWGEGSIREIGPGRFLARAPAGVVGGKRVRPSKVLPSLAEARAWLREHLGRRDRGRQVAGGGQTLREWYDGWIAEKRNATEDGTAAKYEQHFRLHILPALGGCRLRALTADGVRAWLKALEEGDVSRAMRKKVLTSLGVCLNSAVRGNKLAANPLDAIERPTHKPAEVEVYSPAECRHLLAALPPGQFGALFRLLLDSGCRPAEALALRWSDVGADGRVRFSKSLQAVRVAGQELYKVKATKTPAGNRQVRTGPETASLLTALRDSRPEGEAGPTDRVFVGESSGGWVCYSAVSAAWDRLVEAAGVPRRKLYTLRHTSASLLLAGGVSVRTVSARLGHETVEMTLRVYAHLMPGGDDVAAEVLSRAFQEPPQTNGKRTGKDREKRVTKKPT